MASSSSPPGATRKYVLDSSVFFSEWRLEGEYSTVQEVVEELRDARSRCRLELFMSQGLTVAEPGGESLHVVEGVERQLGESGRLSRADRSLLALALDRGAAIVTDDFAIQNVAQALGVTVVPVQQRRARPRRYRYVCTGCGRIGMQAGACPVCGAGMRRTTR